MTVSSKVRIYDLAKELKLDTKRLIEEVRREGVDVSVPSNSVSKELAEKIRNKYFPKKETAVKRAVKVVKRAARPVEEAPLVEAEPETPAPEHTTAAPAPIEVATPAPVVAPKPTTARLVKKLTPAARAEQPVDVPVEEELPPLTEIVPEVEETPELEVPVEAAPPARV
jgi:translation initiation factor IF-2